MRFLRASFDNEYEDDGDEDLDEDSDWDDDSGDMVIDDEEIESAIELGEEIEIVDQETGESFIVNPKQKEDE